MPRQSWPARGLGDRHAVDVGPHSPHAVVLRRLDRNRLVRDVDAGVLARQLTHLREPLVDDGFAVWLIGSPNDKAIAAPIAAALGSVRDLTGRTDLGTAIDLLSLASVVVSNDSGLMHAAAAVGRPLVALFGSSSPDYTPPLSPMAKIARIDIVCSPCFQRECPLGHFKCMRDLAPDHVYDLARSAAA